MQNVLKDISIFSILIGHSQCENLILSRLRGDMKNNSCEKWGSVLGFSWKITPNIFHYQIYLWKQWFHQKIFSKKCSSKYSLIFFTFLFYSYHHTEGLREAGEFIPPDWKIGCRQSCADIFAKCHKKQLFRNRIHCPVFVSR